MDARLAQIEATRFNVVVNLAFTWAGEDLAQPVRYFMAIANAPSPTKDALSLGLLEGALDPDGHGLQGVLELTAEGRLLVRRFRRRAGSGFS